MSLIYPIVIGAFDLAGIFFNGRMLLSLAENKTKCQLGKQTGIWINCCTFEEMISSKVQQFIQMPVCFASHSSY